MEDFLAISRTLPNQGKGLLRSVRDTVQQVRAEDPSLAGYRLKDLGLVNHGDTVEVKLYFGVE